MEKSVREIYANIISSLDELTQYKAFLDSLRIDEKEAASRNGFDYNQLIGYLADLRDVVGEMDKFKRAFGKDPFLMSKKAHLMEESSQIASLLF